ncbi:MAG: hypothetical protein ABUK01_13235 [Leptospirales bacterium]
MKRIFYLFIITTLFYSCSNAEKNSLEGFKYLEQGKDMRAYHFFDLALQQSQDFPLALYGKGLLMFKNPSTVHMARNMLLNALPELEGKYKLGAYEALAKSYRLYNQQAEAVGILKRAIKESVDQPAIYLLLIDNYTDLRKYTLIQRTFDSALELYPENIDLLKKAALFEITHSRSLKNSRKLYNQIIEIAPQDVESLWKLSVISYKLGERDQAIEYLDKLLKLEEDPEKKSQYEEWKNLAKRKRWKPSL